MLGVQHGRFAVFADGGVLIRAGGDCARIAFGGPLVAADTIHEHSVDGTSYPLSLNARFDLARINATTLRLRAGGGVLLGSDIPFMQLGAGARFSAGSPGVGVELLYTRFRYDRERVITDPPNAGEVRSVASSKVANPLAVRVLLEW
jgi:hypothetical protein